LRALAVGHDVGEQRDVAAGSTDLRLVVRTQSRVRVRATTPEGQVLRSFELTLLRSFADQGGRVAAVPEVPAQRVRLDGMTDFAELRVPVGRFRCQVEAEGFAKSFSDEFDNLRKPDDTDPARQFELTVAMSVGATLRGRVVDEDGAPLAGARLTTQATGTQPDHPLLRLLAGSLPDRVTHTTATTAADGTFVVPRLTLADYQLLVEHADACRTIVGGTSGTAIRIDREREHELPPIRMPRGALVTGRATIAGRAAGQVKVVLETAPAPPNPQDVVRLETVSDAGGVYRMPRRVPPGSYALRAAVVGTVAPEAQAFDQLLQMQRSSLAVAVPTGQRTVERDIDLPANH
jgi:hypothetical protein